MGKIKINNEIFEYKVALFQPTLGTHGTIFLTFDINQFPEYKKIFFDIYDNKKDFEIITTKLISVGNIISSIDYDVNKQILNLTIKTELLTHIDQQTRRDEIIDEILNSTFDKGTTNF